MFTLIFYLCTSTGCIPVANENVLRTKESCQVLAESIIQYQQKEVELGRFPPHTVDYQCIFWGPKA